MILYDKKGTPVAYSEESGNIFLFTGQPMAYLFEDTVYGFNGHQFGWNENGWIRDLEGNCVFYSESADASGPIQPIKRVTPVKQVKQIVPIKQIREIKRIKAIKRIRWSVLSGVQFFNQ